MIKAIIVGVFALVVSVFATGAVHGQTATPTTAPTSTTTTMSPTATVTPTHAVPTSAPSTGHGAY